MEVHFVKRWEIMNYPHRSFDPKYNPSDWEAFCKMCPILGIEPGMDTNGILWRFYLYGRWDERDANEESKKWDDFKEYAE